MPLPLDQFYDAVDPALVPTTAEGEDNTPDDGRFLNLLSQAESQATTLHTEMQNRWQKSYRAMRNEHGSGSKYLTDQWAKRSRIFVPKTRTAMEKLLVTAAGALFSTQDVVNIEAQNGESQQDRDAAMVMQEIINVRLDRATGKTSIPWFLRAMGARQDAAVTGLCASYQYWLYRRELIEERWEPLMSDDGITPIIDETGEPVMRDASQYRVIQNRPDVALLPPEHVLFSPNAEWDRIAQSSPYLIIKWPMSAQDILAMCKPDNGKNVSWRNVTLDDIRASGATQQTDTTGVRSAREGRDRYNDPATGEDEWNTYWARLVFMRLDGVDYTFWALGTGKLLSNPQPVEEVYPEQGGERPIVIGTDRVEPHKLYPMSYAESLQPLQQEINDLRNLRLDAVKMAAYPPKSVIRGRQVDFKQLSQYGPDVKWLVQAHDDVQERSSAGPHPTSFAEMDRLSVDFDDVAGLFNTGTVQTTRTLNETVGGMKMLNANASAVSEFSLRVWVETWVEPVLGQIIRLESYYEDDKTVIALAGKKAGVFPRFNQFADLDDLLMRQMLVRVNVGIGSVNPVDKLAKFAQAAQMTAQIMGPAIARGEVSLNYQEILAEIWGPAGFRDAGDRFFKFRDPNQPPPPDPQAQAQQAEMEFQMRKHQDEMALEREKIAADAQATVAKAQIEARTRAIIAMMESEADARLEQNRMRMQDAAEQRSLAVQQQTAMQERGPAVQVSANESLAQIVGGMVQNSQAVNEAIAQQGQQIGTLAEAITSAAEAMGAAAQSIDRAAQAMTEDKEVVLPDGRTFRTSRPQPRMV